MNNLADPQTGASSTLAKGTLGIYEFNIKNILKEAWHKIHGIKGTYWKAFFLTLFITLGILLASFLILVFIDLIVAHWFHISKTQITFYNKILIALYEIATPFYITPLTTGILMIGVMWSVGERVFASSIFQYFRYWKKLWVLPFVLLVLEMAMEYSKWYIELPLFLLNIYISVSYFLFYPLIAEKNLSVWEALEASRKAISYHWFKTLWFFIVLSFIMIGSLLTLGILFIWTLPMLNNAIGILYREIFGVQKTFSDQIAV